MKVGDKVREKGESGPLGVVVAIGKGPLAITGPSWDEVFPYVGIDDHDPAWHGNLAALTNAQEEGEHEGW